MVGRGTIFHRTTPSAAGPLVRFTVHTNCDDICTHLRDASKLCPQVHFTISHDETGIWMLFGYNSWQMMRIDRLKGSPVMSMTWAPPLSTLTRPVMVFLEIPDIVLPLTTSIPAQVSSSMQLALWFLQASLRMNPSDLLLTANYLSATGICSAWPLRLDHPGLNEPTKPPFMPYMIEALKHPVDCKYGHELQHAIHDMELLSKLSKKFNVCAADRNIEDTWMVIFWSSRLEFQEYIRCNQPSFYIEWDELYHVQVMDATIAHKSSALLVSFPDKPTTSKISRTAETLAEYMEFSGATRKKTNNRWIISEPIYHTNQRLFRADGRCNYYYMDRVLSPHYRRVLATTDSPVPTIAGTLHNGTDDNPARPRLIVFWIRQSNDDKQTSIARQLWSMLTKLDETILPLQSVDRVIIAIEFCSSSKHPWHDRRLPRAILPKMRQSLETTLLTANPNRLTRRAEEITDILQALNERAARWRTTGVISDDLRRGDWFHVAANTSQDIERQLNTDREFALQLGHYLRCISAMVRCLTGGDHGTLRDAIGFACQYHKIKRIIIWARTSPTSEITDKYSTSIERQIEFIRAIMPKGIPFSTVRAKSV